MAQRSVKVRDIKDVSGKVSIAGRDIIKNIKTIYQRALTAAEEAARGRKIERKLLAQGVSLLVQNLSIQAGQSTEGESPYKGLLAYNLNEAEIFFGRKAAKKDLLKCISQDPLTILHGESGAGKSSLLQAGIAAQLIANGHLAIRLRSHNADLVEFIKRTFLPELSQVPVLAKASLREFLRQVCVILGSKVNLYLLLDQFEEFFHLFTKEERQPFLESLADCLNDSSLKVRWVLAIRAEALSDLAELESFGIGPFKNLYRLNRLSRVEAHEAIIEPAKRYGIKFEKTLIDHILDTLTTDYEVTPTQLQLVCSALTDELPEDKLLTLTYYTDHEGGTERILRDYLKRQLEHLPAEEQASAWKVMRALITADRLRAVKTHDEIVKELKPSGISREQIDILLARLVERRLLTTQPTATETFELAHDYLVKEIELDPQEQALKAAQELLDQETHTYQRHKTLITAERLAVIEPYRDQLRLSTDAETLLTESQKAVKQEQRARERRRNIMLASSFAAVIAMTVLALWGFSSSQDAKQQANIARSGELAALALSEKDSHFSLALLLGVKAVQTDENSRTESALLTLTNTHPQLDTYLSGQSDDVKSVAFSPNGKQLASASKDGTIILWDVSNLTHPIKLAVMEHNDSVYSVAFSPDGKTLASGSLNQTISLWDLSHPTQPINLFTVSDYGGYGVLSIAFSPDGKRLASASLDDVFLWDASDPTKLVRLASLSGHRGFVYSVAFSPDGKRLVSAEQNHIVILWDVETGQPIGKPLSGHTNWVRSAVFSPDGKMLASGGLDKAIILWSLVDPAHPVKLSSIKHSGSVYSVAFSLDGKVLASATDDNTIMLWDVSDPTHPTELATLLGHGNIVYSVAFSPDGNHLASGSRDSTVIVWELSDPTHSIKLSTPQYGNNISSAAFSLDRRRLISGNLDGSIILWDISKPNHPIKLTTFTGYPNSVISMALSPDNKLLVSGSCINFAGIICSQGEITFTDISRLGNPVKLFSRSVNGMLMDNDFAYSLSFSSDGKHLALGAEFDTIDLWDLQSPTNPVELTISGKRNSGPFHSISFSPDNKWIVSGSSDKTISLWDLSNPTNRVKFSGHSDIVSGVAFSPDGKRLASGSLDGKIILWDLSDYMRPIKFSTLSIDNGSVISLAFSMDGRQLLATGSEGVIVLWNVDPESWIQEACQRAGRNFTRAEWNEYIHDEPYPKEQQDATCPQWPLGPEAILAVSPTP